MSRNKLLCLPLGVGISLAAQNLPPRPLPLPPDDQQATEAQNAAPARKLTPAQQIERWRVRAEQGDKDAPFELGFVYLIGQGVTQDSAQAEAFFKKAEMTPSRMCFVAEAYMETSLAGRVAAARRWAEEANQGCGYWEQAEWIATRRLDGDTAMQIVLLKKGLEAKDDGYRRPMRAQLGELMLTGTKIDATQAERVSWIGEAARTRLANAEMMIAGIYQQNPEQAESPLTGLEWVRKAARYGQPQALQTIGVAVMSRQISDMTYLDGMAFYVLGLRQNPLSAVGLDVELKKLDPEQRESLLDAVASWQRLANEAGGYYTRADALRMSVGTRPDEPAGGVDFALLEKGATIENPDAQLRLAYAREAKEELDKAERLYRNVALDGPTQLWMNLAVAAAKAVKWKWARDLYERAATLGSRPACAEVARIDAEGLAGEKDSVGAYVWLQRSGTRDTKLLEQRKNALTAEQLKAADLEQAKWIFQHQADYSQSEVKAAEEKLAASQPVMNIIPSKPPMTPEMRAAMKGKADAGDKQAAFDLAIEMLHGDGSAGGVVKIEHYATLGAVNAGLKAEIAQAYGRASFIDDQTRGKYLLKWWTAVGGSRGPYEIAQIYYGHSDGTVATDDERKAVVYWEKSVAGGDERWARLSRMKLGYCVVKGWSSGIKAKDAAWAHELAMEMMGKEYYQIAGEYSYGRELEHDRPTYLRLAERGATYNIDNAQGEVARGILNGEWKPGTDLDAYAWLKLQALKQDVPRQQLDTAEKDPELKQKIADRYAQLLKTRAETGAYYVTDDPLRTASFSDVEDRARVDDPEAQFRLGALLEKRGTPRDLVRAIALYRQIWRTAGPEVRLAWGRMLMRSSSSRDIKGAGKFIWDAANAGSHEACRDLATMSADPAKPDPVATEAWRELAGDKAAPLNADQKSAVAARVADWVGKHPDWNAAGKN